MKTLTQLYDEKLKYGHYITLMKHRNNNIFITFIGCSDFVISSNYYGVCALGRRSYDYDTKKATYKVQIIQDAYFKSTLSKLIFKHEKKFTGQAVINFCEVLENEKITKK